MKKRRSEYDSPVDALVAVSKRISVYEDGHQMTSEDFFDKYCKGQLDDSADFIEWSNDYQHYLAIRLAIEKQLQHVA